MHVTPSVYMEKQGYRVVLLRKRCYKITVWERKYG